MTFAVASKTARSSTNDTVPGSGTTTVNGSVQTGMNLYYTAIPALLALCAFALIVYTRRKEND